MNRQEYAKQINWNGTATRIIRTNELPNYEIGEKINAGLCWTDGGEFKIESDGEYNIIFKITESVDGHQVDYENEQECYDLDCEDCELESEILIDREFEIVDIWNYDEETGFMEVYLK